MTKLKLGLFGTAAILAMSATAAAADDLSALKAEIEALNARVAELEAAPQAPAGYRLLSITDAVVQPWEGDKRSDIVNRESRSTVISVMPTADVPESTTIEWHGEIRAALRYHETEDWTSATSTIVISEEEALDVQARGRLWVKATTETSVGEVGVQIRLESDVGIADAGEELNMDIAWGWWQMTPELQLAGGYTASTAYIPHGMDDATTFGSTGGITNRDTDQMRLTYSNGPMSWSIAVEDSESQTTGGITKLQGGIGLGLLGVTATSYVYAGNTAADRGDLPAIASRFTYAGDVFSATIAGIWQDDDGGAGVSFFGSLPTGPTPVSTFLTAQGEDDWFVGGGLTYAGDMFLLSVAGGLGEGYQGAYNGAETPAPDDSYWGASAFASINLSESGRIEMGYGYSELDWLETYGLFYGVETHTVNAGLYYNPVSQLTVGMVGDWRLAEYDATTFGWETESWSAAFVTWFTF